jgi:hypothetical protein
MSVADYPADLIALMICSAEISAGARICTVSDAKFTEAFTPGISLSVRSIVLTQEEQVIPETEYV